MVGIKITQEIKDKNSINAVVGTIQIRSDYPKRFFVTENVVGGYASRTDLHANDGWKPYVDPTKEQGFNERTQKAGSLIETQTSFTREVVAKTQKEIDAYDNLSEDSTNYAITQNLRQAEGSKLINRFFAKIHKDVDDGVLTAGRAVKVSNYMKDGLQFLGWGEMELSKNSFNNIDLSSETNANQQAIQVYIDLAIQKINTYLNNEA